METELQKHLKRLRDKLTRAQQAESLYVCRNCAHKHDGYEFLRNELLKVADALKSAAVSPQSLESQVVHATNVGGHNVIVSLLEAIDSLAKSAPKLSEQVKRVELNNSEELERLG